MYNLIWSNKMAVKIEGRPNIIVVEQITLIFNVIRIYFHTDEMYIYKFKLFAFDPKANALSSTN